mmetsp:Transcript_108155/g.312555  ORF Transcript_108155/g.312555 Transcript_108155/m.312555 type:complete len:84 (+) Transcript_108155:184-435(+)
MMPHGMPLQSLDVALSASKGSLAGFYISSVHLDHTSAAVSFLAIDRNLDTSSTSHNRQLLPNNRTLDSFTIDSDIVVVVGPTT